MDLLYKRIESSTIFTSKEICKNCNSLCSRDWRWHWLLPDEAKKLSAYFDIKVIDKAHFFNDGLCPNLFNTECSIYERRPLECRLSPISIYQISRKLHWIFDLNCNYLNCYRLESDFKNRILNHISSLEKYFTEMDLNDISKISNVINKIQPFKENIDFVKLKAFL
ncbi:YkgJ family cysteine cluster protein [bacterium]|nr:YkgJ family cysteine cluster protein [bacterium]